MRLHQRLLPLGYAAARIVIPGGRWSLQGSGYCPSCDSPTVFVLANSHAQWIRGLTQSWANSPAFKSGLIIRESELCAICRANFRIRAQAQTLLRLLCLDKTESLIWKLRRQRDFRIYETAHCNVFRDDEILALPNYITSEYVESARPGEIVNGRMNQNLEQLTFADEMFDVVLTSEVLEHVVDLGRALGEIYRVLKPGGYHVFTVPSDPGLERTIERARLVDGRVVHLMPAVMHGDSIRSAGILAFRDFGSDTTTVIDRFGFRCQESVLSGTFGFITSVYTATKIV